MNRREFLKTTGASGLALVAPITLSSKASAADFAPVGQYFVFAHLGGGWDPTTFCNPKGNKLRSVVNAELPVPGSRVTRGESPVNRFPESAIRRAADIYIGSGTVSTNVTYAPYLGTYNELAADDSIDDGSANDGFSIEHIRRILAGSIDLVGSEITAAADGLNWASVDKTVVKTNAEAILEGSVTNIVLGTITGANAGQVRNRNGNLDNSFDGANIDADVFRYDAFVCLYAHQMRVLNGVDNQTNSHDTGTRYADTGSMSMGYPDFSALYAAVHGASRPLAWMTDGRGNDETAGIVARSSASDANFFGILANPKNGMVDFVDTELEQAQALRKEIQARKDNLPLRRQLQDQLYLVRESGGEFSSVASDILNPTTNAQQAVQALATNSTRRHMRVGAAGFYTGMASSMQVGFGGFDTHGNHDNSHFARIRTVLEDLHFLFKALDSYEVLEQTTVIVGSDFGRTPWFNDGNGKDHWAVSSYLLFGNHVAGGTEVNATNGLVNAVNVDNSGSDIVVGGSTRMTAAHLHKQLRKKAGIESAAETLQFPIEVGELNMFG
ncbi:DUF1501 domain-containing protein [Reinekea sp.]|jgi:uncharacterized protein (DUF1501 family)|uniref:DUF1501 domain-containing protein n=1 Tax=Reinekea sp. TaxID=1970455 RepID=UPI0039897848